MAFAILSRPKRAAAVSSNLVRKRKASHGQRATYSQPRFEGHAAWLPMAPVIQTKLKIGEQNDKFEQEADRVAEQVMRMPDSEMAQISGTGEAVKRKCAACASGKSLCPKCAPEEEQLHRKPLLPRTKTSAGQAPQLTSQLSAQISALRGSGRPLPPSARAFFEPRFGADFTGVRVHTDGRAAQLARAVNARAFTLGRDVVFGAGQYEPMTASGKTLLAHELVHVAQQADGIQGVIGRQANHTFEDCNNKQKKQIEAAAKGARKAVNRAPAFVGSAYGRPDKMSARTRLLLQTHFHTTKRGHLRDILSTFLSIQSAFAEGVDFECEQTCKPISGTIPCGYAYTIQLFGGLGNVHLCFDTGSGQCHFMTSLTAQEREVLLIHEVAHRYAGVDDKAYEFEPEYSKLSPNEAIDNADSYAWFAVQV
ncbi:MAG: eCIS core domain-containing protein [Gammaproteobacteria bacterium]